MTKYKIKCREGLITHQGDKLRAPNILYQGDYPLEVCGLYCTLLSLKDSETDLASLTACEKEKSQISHYLDLLSLKNPYTKIPFITLEGNTIWLEDVYKNIFEIQQPQE